MEKIRAAGQLKYIRFGAVGVINTFIDFFLLNVLHLVVGFPRIPSNVISSSVAMTFSFIANKSFVFKAKGKTELRQVAYFLAITAFGLYILQNLVIYFLSEKFMWPADFAYSIVEAIGLDSVFSRQFIGVNVAKIAATAVSLIWNYTMYKRYVFPAKPEAMKEEEVE